MKKVNPIGFTFFRDSSGCAYISDHEGSVDSVEYDDCFSNLDIANAILDYIGEDNEDSNQEEAKEDN